MTFLKSQEILDELKDNFSGSLLESNFLISMSLDRASNILFLPKNPPTALDYNCQMLRKISFDGIPLYYDSLFDSRTERLVGYRCLPENEMVDLFFKKMLAYGNVLKNEYFYEIFFLTKDKEQKNNYKNLEDCCFGNNYFYVNQNEVPLIVTFDPIWLNKEIIISLIDN